LFWIDIVMRILLTNQDASTRSSLGILFKAQSDMEVVGEPSTMSQLLSVVRTRRPDVVIVDFDLLTEPVDTLLGMLQSLDHPPAVVGMSIRAERRQTALDAGADAFAYKGDPPDRLLSAIRTAYNQRGESRQE
jgi:DNA-binding NarL/FixJ family response regulator